ncbi:MAG: aconitate hydratase, partial [Actinobacteria bacterium]|nr:aconitate hydratase [Actinomycetota bacterium]
REHAAIAPRYLGLRVVIAKSYARIHWQNLVNFGVLPLEFTDPGDYDRINPGDRLTLGNLRDALSNGADITIRNATAGNSCQARHRLSPRQTRIVLAGGQIPLLSQ